MTEDLVPLTLALSCGGIFALFAAALGVFLIVLGLRSRKKAAQSQSWPSVAGEIIRAEVKQSVTTDDDGRASYAYYPTVEYAYRVGGHAFTGRRLAFGGVVAHKSQAQAAAELARLPVGTEVVVYYSPENPAEAVLERQAGGSQWGLIVGLVCLVIGACIACPLVGAVVRSLLSPR